MMEPVVIALGSNLDQPKQRLQAAVAAIARLPETEIVRVSSLYRTKPVGYAEQPDFINAVLLARTGLQADALLRALQRIETEGGRVRSFRNAPRTLDLDIIDYAGQVWAAQDLELPHPRAHERGFVMVPLAEIAPDYWLHGRRVADWAQALRAQALADDLLPVAAPPGIGRADDGIANVREGA